jgi:D-lactate dehydrogenase
MRFDAQTRSDFIKSLTEVVGASHVLTAGLAMRSYVNGFRFGSGDAVAVVRPGTLVEFWKVLDACNSAGTVIIVQASNTGLTGGSTPYGSDYDREVVVINTMRIKKITLIGGGRQVVALPGDTLNELEFALASIGREPHSVIGSSCLGASIIGGVCNNSGGALVSRGPAFTELALFAQVNSDGGLELVNHLGIDLGGDPLEILSRLEKGAFAEADIQWAGRASDETYRYRVRDVDADTPARFNGDVRNLFEASGSSGKLAVFAVRLDTFQAEKNTKTFYIGTNQSDVLNRIRRAVLTEIDDIPISGEYIHRDAFRVAETYGKDIYLFLKYFGTRHVGRLFSLKARLNGFFRALPLVKSDVADIALQAISNLLPAHLPRALRDFRDRYEHHLILKVKGASAGQIQALLLIERTEGTADFIDCDEPLAKAAFLHRFAVAGAAIRYTQCNGSGATALVALDIAYPRNSRAWNEPLPQRLAEKVVCFLNYGHFLCHVFHKDYVVTDGVDGHVFEEEVLADIDRFSVRYPAEHNFGHLYGAREEVKSHFRTLDPCNCFNPGIAGTSKRLRWKHNLFERHACQESESSGRGAARF